MHPYRDRTSYWRFGGVLLLCLLAALLWPRSGQSPAEAQAQAQGRVIITYWDRHSGHEHEARKTLIQEFNQSQSEIYVRTLPIGYNALMEKTLTSTAGHNPPDIMSMDGGILVQLATQGVVLPLDDLVANEAELQPEAFLPHIWKMVHFQGHVWGLPTSTDTYCLLWNKKAFRKAGLDPERPPRNMKELEAYAAKLTIHNAKGGIEQIGFLPWLPWDHSFLFGLLFGGSWYNQATGRSECGHDPGIIQSLAWQQSFTLDPQRSTQLPYAMDPERIAAFSRGLGEYMSANNPFYSGKAAMIVEGEWQATFIPIYAPNLDWGVAPLPQPEGVAPCGYGPTCIAEVIPATARHPKEAKQFLRWFYRNRAKGATSPASDYCYAIHNIPTRWEDTQQQRFLADPKFRVFIEELTTKPVHSFPVLPVTQYLTDQIERVREWVTLREMTAQEAALEVERNVNRELERVRALMKRRAAS